MNELNETAGRCAPHSVVRPSGRRDRFALSLFDELWRTYRERVPYVRTYEQVVARHGATFVNDHIAFRTIASQKPFVGIATVSRVFESLGYRAAGCYFFPDKFLSSIHFQHPTAGFPKLFISELWSWELAPAAQQALARVLANHRPPIADSILVELSRLDQGEGAWRDGLLDELVAFFQQLPWEPPQRADVETLNAQSQFGAWVSVHGYNVNHFTALVNSHAVPNLDDIEKTVEAMIRAKVPMKKEIEGARGSKLRQTATEAVILEVPVRDGSTSTAMPWTYAYFEIAERGVVFDPSSGQDVRFEGFLGPQATQLFEMTRLAT